MVTIDCWDPNCAAQCLLTDRHHKLAKEQGRTFFCSAGHSNVFRESEVDKLRKQVTKLKSQLDQAGRKIGMLSIRWRCPFGGCGYQCDSQGTMVSHIKRHHKDVFAPKLLEAQTPPHPDDERMKRNVVH